MVIRERHYLQASAVLFMFTQRRLFFCIALCFARRQCVYTSLQKDTISQRWGALFPPKGTRIQTKHDKLEFDNKRNFRILIKVFYIRVFANTRQLNSNPRFPNWAKQRWECAARASVSARAGLGQTLASLPAAIVSRQIHGRFLAQT